jgi:hypothetical protein
MNGNSALDWRPFEEMMASKILSSSRVRRADEWQRSPAAWGPGKHALLAPAFLAEFLALAKRCCGPPDQRVRLFSSHNAGRFRSRSVKFSFWETQRVGNSVTRDFTIGKFRELRWPARWLQRVRRTLIRLCAIPHNYG